jgi:hypothetical protein
MILRINKDYFPKHYLPDLFVIYAGPSGSAVKGVGLRPLACRDRAFESYPGA